jgi:hypothetical protein
MVIDLSRLRKTRVDTEKNHIIAQGGALWLDVDQAGAEHKLATGTSQIQRRIIGSRGDSQSYWYRWVDTRRRVRLAKWTIWVSHSPDEI